MASKKQDAAAKAALAALHIGETEQARRMPTPTQGKSPGQLKVQKTQVSVQFSAEGLEILHKAQARLLERGVHRAGNKGTTLEIVLVEWLEQIPG